MAGKRYSESVDHVIYNKMSRMETASQPSTPCSGKTVSSDPQTYMKFLSYPLSGTEEQHSSNPWSSATSYLQYAGKALNQHLQFNGVSKCQRLEADKPFNSLHLSEKSSGHFPVYQHHPVHNYHTSPSRSYPPIAVPRPVYGSPSSFIDPAYGTRDFHSMGGHIASHPLGPPALHWSPSTRFTSSFYGPGFKNPHLTVNSYSEVPGSPSSHPRAFQELSPSHRQRTDVNVPVESSTSCPREDVLTDQLHSFAQHNLQVLYSEGTVPIGKQRNSAFTSLKHQHYKSSSYSLSPERRVDHMYSKSYYNSAIDSSHQRTPPFPCSTEKSLSPHGIKGAASNQVKAQKAYMDTQPGIVSHMDSMMEAGQFQAHQETPIKSTSRTNQEREICPDQKEKDLCLGSDRVNGDLCVTSTKLDKEFLFGSSRASSNLHNRNLYGYCVTELSSHVSFPQQNNSKILPALLSNSMVSNDRGGKNLPFSINDSRNALDSMRVLYAKSSESTVQHHREKPNTEHLKSRMLDLLASDDVDKHKRNDKETSRHEDGAVDNQSSDLPEAKSRDVDCPKSPPMPVINDVFSLAPYRAYLEGKAPHPFPIHEKSEVEKELSASLSQQSYAAKKAEDSAKENVKSGNAEKDNMLCSKSTNTVHKQTKESQGDSSTDSVAVEVLDLSCKRSSPIKSTLQDQGHTSQKNHKPSPEKVTESSFAITSEETFNKCQERCSSEVTGSHLKNKISTSHATSCLESSLSRTAGGISPLTQEGFFPAKTYNCQDRCSFQEPETLPRLLQRSYSCPTPNSLPHKTFTNHGLHSNESDHLPLHKNYSNRAPPNLKNSTVLSPNKCQYQAAEHKSKQISESPKQVHERYKHQMGRYLPIQANETQKQQTRCTPQTTPTLQQRSEQNSLSRTTENMPGHGFFNSISHPTETYSLYSSACSTQATNISLFVNTLQAPASLFPQSIIYPHPSPIFCSKNLKLPSHSDQLNKPNEKKSRNMVDSYQPETSPSGSENEAAGFHSSKAFMFHKYKMMKLPSPGVEIQESRSPSYILPRSFSLPSDAAQSLPPSAPESSPTLGEANVSLASVGELAPTGSGKQFSELHRSVRTAITSSVARSPSNILEDWLQKNKEEEGNKTPVKNKNGSRSSEPASEKPGHKIWMQFEGVTLRLHKLLSQLETFMFTRSCPFPHVIRAGAIFIPIYLVKEVLFPELLGTSVDRILQRHKVELRPTTLSEEKLLRDTELKDCSSRMLKLLALKQLPDMYPDLLHLFCGHTIQDQLGSRTQSGMHTPK